MDASAADPDRTDSLSGNLSAQAHAAISRMIRTRQLRAGEAIVEAKLADSLAISRTPIREALQRLEGEGLIIKSAGRSFMVRRVGLGEYLQSLKVREILEPETAVLATGHIDRAAIADVRRQIEDLGRAEVYSREAHWDCDASLHNLFIDACGNDVMAATVRLLRATTHLFEVARLHDRLNPDNAEHLDILDSLAAGDVKAVRKAVQKHIRSLHRFAIEVAG